MQAESTAEKKSAHLLSRRPPTPFRPISTPLCSRSRREHPVPRPVNFYR